MVHCDTQRPACWHDRVRAALHGLQQPQRRLIPDSALVSLWPQLPTGAAKPGMRSPICVATPHLARCSPTLIPWTSRHEHFSMRFRRWTCPGCYICNGRVPGTLDETLRRVSMSGMPWFTSCNALMAHICTPAPRSESTQATPTILSSVFSKSPYLCQATL